MKMQLQRTRRTRKTTRKKYRFIKGQKSPTPRKRKKKTAVAPAPVRNSIKKVKTQKTSVGKTMRRKKTSVQDPGRGVTGIAIDAPGWDELKSTQNDRVKSSGDESQLLSTLSTVRFSLGILAVAALFTLYVGHVQATKNLLNDVYQVRKENLTLNLKYNQLQGEYDTAIGPAVIYKRAGALGLRERRQVATSVYLRSERR